MRFINPSPLKDIENMLTQGSQVLVSGASGFIGAELCLALRNRGCAVRTTGRSDGASIVLDMAKPDTYPPALCAGIEVVFHLAGKAHALAENRQDESEYRQINAEGTRKLLEAARDAGVKVFVFFSSVKAVGASGRPPQDETVIEPANDPYGASKYDAEQLVLHGGYVPHPVVLRPSMVYGNTEKGNLPRMIRAVRRGFFPPLPELANRRSMVHVKDLVAAAMLAAEKSSAAGQIYIVTDSHDYSTRQIFDQIRAELGRPRIDWSVPMPLLNALAKLGDGFGRLLGRRMPIDSDSLKKLTDSAWYSSDKICRELGFRPRHTLSEALPDIIRFLS
ncbi:NAD-dependent epimerase/dehydratase family protein [Methylomonas montana]|uniref:NAD-dependent epimerase/dehydratase family protein n=1 Tax=Methylomonas montana TaxID=3058963 RepID=UPI00265B42FE|nr:NAD-dependent epimerase/dehydratase family protein [Methylomonas montana]WKJ90110.1 NAD-dependent epimerase/dehydratase family protein [Methylomonas montana]